MPQTKSAKKRLKQDIKRRAANRAGRSKLRTMVKKVDAALAAGDATAIKGAFQAAQKALDQAAAKGLIHDNAAARLKSRINARVKAAAAKA
jgi:small subunit ribosomal protein S20